MWMKWVEWFCCFTQEINTREKSRGNVCRTYVNMQMQPICRRGSCQITVKEQVPRRKPRQGLDCLHRLPWVEPLKKESFFHMCNFCYAQGNRTIFFILLFRSQTALREDQSLLAVSPSSGNSLQTPKFWPAVGHNNKAVWQSDKSQM